LASVGQKPMNLSIATLSALALCLSSVETCRGPANGILLGLDDTNIAASLQEVLGRGANRVNPADIDNFAIGWASGNGHTDAIKQMIS
jgi:hypothetical protein